MTGSKSLHNLRMFTGSAMDTYDSGVDTSRLLSTSASKR